LLSLLVVALSAQGERAPVDFVTDVQPIFAKSCYSCHGPEKHKSDYRLDARQIALRGGSIGGAIVPGDSAHSKLLEYVTGTAADEEMLMPPKGERLTAEQIDTLRAWIDQGAKWPDGANFKPGDSEHWSLKPLVRPALPSPKDAAAIRTPIDAFILAKVEERGFVTSPMADERTLIRRVTYDLIGLPPTPTEVAAFLADESADAYEKLVDRLLASPRYGERWARHWLDVVHYADSHGFGMDRPRANGWPYRDYVIDSFNADKPYGRFVQEQVAGDVMYPDDPAATVALGMIAAGPWNQSPIAEQMDEVDCKKIAQVIDRDDMVTTVMTTFVSTTVQCARCHNHKFDPVSQQEYYDLQAVFAGVDRVDRPYDADPAVHVQRQKLLRLRAQLNAPGAKAIGDAQGFVEPYEKSVAAARSAWTPLDPATFTSSGGAALTKQGDRSLLVSGAKPDKDTYTITARSDLPEVTAVRIEALPDDSLPHHGPGRQENGNITLSEFALRVEPSTQPVAIASASADFDQAGWSADKSIDHNPATGWAIYPNVGKAHQIVYELKEPLKGPQTLTFVLEQLHGTAHTIGRPRFSVTSLPKSARDVPVPDSIAAILAIPSSQRAEQQKAALLLHVQKLKVERDLAALPRPKMVYAVWNDFPAYRKFTPAHAPRPIMVLRRGDIHQPTTQASAGALACVPGLPSAFDGVSEGDDESCRRAALARWLADRRNVLTWRSIVNRVWHYHFGHGICDTPGDLGRMGAPPTHPELLDFLATWFRDDAGGSLKRLHRLIVTSRVYMQSCVDVPAFAKEDGGNRYLWRMNRTRLEAECVRDAILAVSGKLDLTAGGPPVDQFHYEDPNVEVTPIVDYGKFDVDSPASFRRSIYRRVFRTMADPLMDALDCPDASTLAAKRNVSVTAIQALAMMNDAFVLRQAEHFAGRLEREHPANVRGQIEAAFWLALSRAPTEKELEEVVAFAQKHGLANACRVILNCNEFVFVN
jgi:mono/diheme cytochrome c family protein